MALLGFQEWKAKKVISGECRQTIRARRKHPIKIGTPLIFAMGCRTKNYRRIGTSVCRETFPLRAITIGPKNEWTWIDISLKRLEEIAHLDGFATAMSMTKWFSKNHHISSNEIAKFDVIRW